MSVAGAFICAPGSPPAWAAEQPATTPEDDTQPLILDVNVGPQTIAAGMIVYQYRARNYLPLIELAGVFDFLTEPDLSRGIINGWALDEKNTFTIDMQRREIIIRGQRETLPDTAILPVEIGGTQDVYIQQEILNRLWPVGMAVNLPALTLDVMADEKMPFMQRIARQNAQNSTIARRAEIAPPENLLAHSNKYRLYGLPAADFETWHRYQTKNRTTEGMLNVTGVQDLAWMTANYSAAIGYRDGETIDPDVIRLRLERDSSAEQPLPFDLQRVELGDTRVRHSPLIGNGSSGRGMMVTSSNKGESGEFDRITIDGTGPIGWEVELYRNNELLNFGRVDARGEYRFEDIVLNFGNNQMRVILYGPQGQVRESTENYQFGSNMLRPGQFTYTLGAVETGEDLIRLREDSRADRFNGFAVTGDVAYGINRAMTAYGSLNTIPTDQNRTRRDYATIGAALSLPFGSLQTEAYQDISQDKTIQKRGNALDVRFITDLAGFKVNLRNALFNHFESPESGYGGNALNRKTQIGVQRNIMLPFSALGLNLDLENLKRNNGDTATSLSTRQTIGFGGVRLAHSTRTEINNNHHDDTSGQLTVTARMNKWRLRSGLDYDIFPDAQFSAFDGELLYQASDRLSASIFARHDMINADSSGGFQVNYDFEKFIGSLETVWVDENGTQVTLRATTSLGPYGRDGQYIMTADRLGSAAMARAHVFMDRDSNGVWSEGDTPLNDARIRVNQSPLTGQTDDMGVLVAQAASGTQDATITLDPASLGDPYYHSLLDGYRTSLRPGSFPRFDFPVIETGAVDGTISYNDGRAVQGIRLDLVGASGAVVQSTESAYDGFYTFEYVPPGAYMVRVDPSYGVDVPPKNITIEPDDPFASGVDLHLIEPATGPNPTPESGPESGPESAPEPTPASTQILRALRMADHANHVRLVLDLSGPAPYNLESLDGGRTLAVTLPHTRAMVDLPAQTPNGIITHSNIENLPGGAAFACACLPATPSKSAQMPFWIRGRRGPESLSTSCAPNPIEMDAFFAIY